MITLVAFFFSRLSRPLIFLLSLKKKAYLIKPSLPLHCMSCEHTHERKGVWWRVSSSIFFFTLSSSSFLSSSQSVMHALHDFLFYFTFVSDHTQHTLTQKKPCRQRRRACTYMILILYLLTFYAVWSTIKKNISQGNKYMKHTYKNKQEIVKGRWFIFCYMVWIDRKRDIIPRGRK